MKNRSFIRVTVSSLVALLSCGLGLAEDSGGRLSAPMASTRETPTPQSWRSTELRRVLSLAQGSSSDWRVPEARAGMDRISRLGAVGSPLEIVDSKGRLLGEVYRIEKAGEHRGVAVLAHPSATEIRSEFEAREWPLDRLSDALKALDADDPLKEPEFRLFVDEDRLVLRVNLGKIEREFEFMPFDPKERRRR